MSKHTSPDAETLQFMADLEQSIKQAQAGVGRVTTPEQLLVRAARARAGLSQQAFAERIATPVATLRDWEQGRFSPPGGVVCLMRLIERHPDLTDELAVH
jgi:putative transcriptional regulator